MLLKTEYLLKKFMLVNKCWLVLTKVTKFQKIPFCDIIWGVRMVPWGHGERFADPRNYRRIQLIVLKQSPSNEQHNHEK